MAKILLSHPRNIKRVASYIAQKKIVVIPYGKQERRIFAIVGLAENDVVERIKRIKKRATSQAVAISGIPDVAPMVAKLDQTPALIKAANNLKITPKEVVEKCFQAGGIGLILIAQDWVPKGATMVKKNGVRSVLIAGEVTDKEYDIFPRVYTYLIKKYGKVMVGTSANLTGDDTYHVMQQSEALEKLGPHVDIFVYDRVRIDTLPILRNLTSTTILDLTEERAEVLRWGSIHPERFRKMFDDLIFEPDKLKKYQGRERLHHVLLRRLFPKL